MRNAMMTVAAMGLAAGAFAAPVLLDGGAITHLEGMHVAPAPFATPQACEEWDNTMVNGWNTGTGWTISNGYAGYWGPAASFSTNGDGFYCDLTVVAGHVVGSNAYDLIMYDGGGTVPGGEQGRVVLPPLPSFGGSATPTTVDGSAIPAIAAGGWIQVWCTGAPGTVWGAHHLTLGGYDRNRAYWSDSSGNWNATFGDPGAFIVEGEVGGGGPSLGMSGSCPGQMTFTATGCTPGGSVAFCYGFGTNLTIPNGNPCAGTVLNVGNPNFGYRTANADASGVATLVANVPAAACRRVNVQALDVRSCLTSNVVNP